MYSFLMILAHLLLGGAFIGFGLRNTGNIGKLAPVLEKKGIRPAVPAAQFGVGLQIVGGVLTVLGAFVPLLSVLGGLCMVVFLVIATLLFHAAWEYPKADRYPHMTAIMMNSALLGGFLLIIASGL